MKEVRGKKSIPKPMTRIFLKISIIKVKINDSPTSFLYTILVMNVAKIQSIIRTITFAIKI